MRRRLVKLVRDRVAPFLDSPEAVFEPIEDEERLLDALDEKLIEEAVEYLKRPSVGELADVLETIRALAIRRHGCGLDAVVNEMLDKRHERGGFTEGMGLFVVGQPPTMRHEGEHAAAN